eukprot:745736-Hanusia_phi.AAC.2
MTGLFKLDQHGVLQFLWSPSLVLLDRSLLNLRRDPLRQPAPLPQPTPAVPVVRRMRGRGGGRREEGGRRGGGREERREGGEEERREGGEEEGRRGVTEEQVDASTRYGRRTASVLQHLDLCAVCGEVTSAPPASQQVSNLVSSPLPSSSTPLLSSPSHQLPGALA